MIIAERLKALVVDDNTYARAIAAMALTRLGVRRVVEAEGGAAAIVSLLAEPFDLVLMDWYMPDVSGAGVLQVLRDPRFGAASTTPVVLMTAYANHDTVARAVALGVDAVLVKPFTAEQLGAAMAKALGAREAATADADDAIFL